MGHNLPYRKNLHHQRISVVKPNTLLKGGPWKDSHDPGPIMSPHTYIILLSKPTKKDRKKKEKYYMYEIRRSKNYTWKQNAQNNFGVSQEREIVNMRHALR
jgi:hypothetical protein